MMRLIGFTAALAGVLTIGIALMMFPMDDQHPPRRMGGGW